MRAKLNYKNIDKEFKDLVAEHNSIVHDARNALAMLSANMSAVKGAPTAAKVAIWRDDIANTMATFKLVKP